MEWALSTIGATVGIGALRVGDTISAYDLRNVSSWKLQFGSVFEI